MNGGQLGLMTVESQGVSYRISYHVRDGLGLGFILFYVFFSTELYLLSVVARVTSPLLDKDSLSVQ